MNKKIFWVGIISFFVLTGCKLFSKSTKAESLPNFGVFISINGEYQQIPDTRGIKISTDTISTEDLQPSVAIYFDNFDISYLELQQIKNGSMANNILITVSKPDKYYQVFPTDDLDPGDYCYIQSNTNLPVEELSTWCFQVVSDVVFYEDGASGGRWSDDQMDAFSAISTDTAATLSEGLEGFFLVVDGNPVEIEKQSRYDIPPWNNEVDINVLPITGSKYPVILVRSSSVSLGELFFNAINAQPGFEWSESSSGEKVIYSVYRDTDAYYKGIGIDDILMSVENPYFSKNGLANGPYDTSVTLDILDGTQLKTLEVKRDMVANQLSLDFSYNVMPEGYVQITTDDQIIGGVYCFGYGSRNNITSRDLWCFYVTP